VRRALRRARGFAHKVRPPRQALWDLSSRSLGPSRLASTEVTDLLFDRLSEGDVAEVESRLNADELALVRATSPDNRKRVLLALGVHYEVAPVLAKTGLIAAAPPEEVHAMGRGSLAGGGTCYYADLVVGALECSNVELREGARALDFGCSSGRVVRVLAAAFPEIHWYGCDPIESSIAWAKENLPGIEFSASRSSPPLDYEDGFFDSAFAISIWSHFAEGAATEWLNEMARVIRPHGCLILTTHGQQSIAYYANNRQRSVEQLAKIAEALYGRGFWYAPEFGEQGDHGLVDPEWGFAFFTPEWLAGKLLPHWRLLDFAPGRAEDNQDVYVLERR
jgi:SAM-dependent methyltransferase